MEGLYFIGAIRWTGLFPPVGADFRALYAAAQIAREQGFAFVYDLERQAVVQTALCQVTPTHTPCVLIPMVFPLVFVLPVIPLTHLGPVPAFLLWSALHIVGTLAILRPWVQRMAGLERRQQLAMALLSFPSFASLFWGQSTLWLLLCVSAFMADWIRRKRFRAGLWASGLLLKLQTLVLLLPALAVARRWDALIGAGIGAVFLLGLSLLLGEPSGMMAWVRTLSGFSALVPGLAPEVVGVETMMNWRSIGALMAHILPSPIAWALVGGAMLVTAGAALLLVRRTDLESPICFERFALGIFAATLASTWGFWMGLATLIKGFPAFAAIPWLIRRPGPTLRGFGAGLLIGIGWGVLWSGVGGWRFMLEHIPEYQRALAPFMPTNNSVLAVLWAFVGPPTRIDRGLSYHGFLQTALPPSFLSGLHLAISTLLIACAWRLIQRPSNLPLMGQSGAWLSIGLFIWPISWINYHIYLLHLSFHPLGLADRSPSVIATLHPHLALRGHIPAHRCPQSRFSH